MASALEVIPIQYSIKLSELIDLITTTKQTVASWLPSACVFGNPCCLSRVYQLLGWTTSVAHDFILSPTSSHCVVQHNFCVVQQQVLENMQISTIGDSLVVRFNKNIYFIIDLSDIVQSYYSLLVFLFKTSGTNSTIFFFLKYVLVENGSTKN